MLCMSESTIDWENFGVKKLRKPYTFAKLKAQKFFILLMSRLIPCSLQCTLNVSDTCIIV